jgi:aspartyl protease family protein
MAAILPLEMTAVAVPAAKRAGSFEMMKFAAIALVGALSAVGAARAVAALEPAALPRASVQLSGAPATPTAPASIAKSRDGHFWAEANVDGKAVRFLVDTGATIVSLTAEDARRLGVDVAHLDYSYDVITADGRTKAASIKLASVSIAGAKIANVDALVVQKGLQTSLLGMSYLGRLQRFEATPTSLILHP